MNMVSTYENVMTGDIRGVIFDVDDTLLDNRHAPNGMNIHEWSRWMATQEVGNRFDIPRLAAVTPEQNQEAFLRAPAHTVEAAAWTILQMVGEVGLTEAIDMEHVLLSEIVRTKQTRHPEILRTYGREMPGAGLFVRRMAEGPAEGRVAIASTAIRPEVYIFLSEIAKIDDLFPEYRIYTKEKTRHHKPHPEAFDRAFVSLGLPDSERGKVLVVEDDPRGIQAAKAAGLYVCAITTRFTPEQLRQQEYAPHMIVDSFHELSHAFRLDG